MNAERLRAESRASIQQSKNAVQTFLALDPGADAPSAVAAIDRVLRPLNGQEGRAQLLSKVHPDADVRDAALEMEQEFSAWETELSLNREIHDRLAKLEQAEGLVADQHRILEVMLRELRRAGVDRDAATRARVRELKEEIVRLGQEFDKNIITGGREFVVSGGHTALAGLPRDFLDAHPEAADGSVVITSDPQDRAAFMTFVEDAELRRAYYRVTMNRAVPENLDVLPKLLAKRHELATLLGHANWADYITEDKMARSGAQAREFIERVIQLARSKADDEYHELLAEKRSANPEANDVHDWERAFLSEKIRQRLHGFDSQSVRPYFSYANVRAGVLQTSARLYGVEFRRATPQEDVWHPSVESYEVLDSGKIIARFYLDMHPRDDKFKHAAMFNITSGVEGECIPEACLVCNFSEPTDDDPALMMRSDVRTFFHEFGHLLHHLFSQQRFVRIAGITCEWDFVEVPSQLYEEWTWDYGVLSSFAKHHETGEPIPRELVDRMRNAEEYGKGLNTLTQMYFAMLALTLYDRDPTGIDPAEHMVALKGETLPFPHEPDTFFVASFGHLNGYSAMYYTYMWSLVIAKDLFSRFEGNVMNRTVANEYRAKVLSKGGSKPASDLVRDFLGHDYGFDAFERWLHH